MPLHTLQIGDKEDSTRYGLSCFATVTHSATALKAQRITDGMSTVTIRLHRRWPADFTILPLQMRCTGATWITSCNRLPPTDCNACSLRLIRAVGHKRRWLMERAVASNTVNS